MSGFRFGRETSAIVWAFAFGASVLAGNLPAHAASRVAQGAQFAKAELPKAAEPGEVTGSLAKGPSDEDPGCFRARKRLWVDGEGWIVRRVTTCR